jgi:hypothetical protein
MSALSLASGQSVTVKGTVTDSATRRPVNGVIIDLASDSKRYSARTDEAGEFRFADIEPGGYRLVTRRIGFTPLVRSVAVTQDMKAVSLGLSPIPATLRTVRVHGEGTGVFGEIGTSTDLKPIIGARVQVAGANQSIFTDSAGAYFIPLQRPGSYVVRVQAEGYADEMFVVKVGRDEVADGSRLLDASTGARIPPGLWNDFDQRLRWRSNNSTLVPGSEIRGASPSLEEAIQRSPSAVRQGLRLGPSVCVLVNGSPRPGLSLNAIRVEEITAIEVYGRDREAVSFLAKQWIGQCSLTYAKARNPNAPEVIRYVVIWTR